VFKILYCWPDLMLTEPHVFPVRSVYVPEMIRHWLDHPVLTESYAFAR